MAEPSNGQPPLRRGQYRVSAPSSTTIVTVLSNEHAVLGDRRVSYAWEPDEVGGGVLQMEGRVFRVTPVGPPPIPGTPTSVEVNGVLMDILVDDARSELLRSVLTSGDGTAADLAVCAPMPGLVVKVEVQDGERVAKGQGLIVLEAMKMENELRAERDGIASDIIVREKTAVEKGQRLLTIRRA